MHVIFLSRQMSASVSSLSASVYHSLHAAVLKMHIDRASQDDVGTGFKFLTPGCTHVGIQTVPRNLGSSLWKPNEDNVEERPPT